MVRKFRRLAELYAAEWPVLFQLTALALLLRVGLKLTTLPRLSGAVARYASNPLLKHLPLLNRKFTLDRLCALADLAARVTYGSGRCLGRSLLILWLLKIRGHPAELLVGVNKQQAVFNAHAWIETEGRVIGDRPETTEQFAILLRT
ncbi:MAG TPA: lasso peptide biosynthesis B2 protein [Candidatus Binataceae bacterium]|nr:lasso peptide biosynthesis B2 protein [Candidatus Binataceae bacterium]